MAVSYSSVEKGINLVTKATEEDKNGNIEEAFKLYKQGVECFIHTIKYEAQSDKAKEIIKTKCKQYLDRAEKLKKDIDDKKENLGAGENSMGTKDNKKGEPRDSASGDEDTDSENRKFNDQIPGAIVMEKPNVKFDDVAGLEEAKLSLKEAVILPAKFPHLFTQRRKPWRGILLFGPPGTGKTYLVKAVATEADYTLLSVSAEDFMSKWLGDSEKLMKRLFQQAKEQRPSIILIDKIDALGLPYYEGGPESRRRLKTEFLVQFEGISKDCDILVIGTTNAPWQLDPAVRKRFEKRIHIPLPEAPGRVAMFQLHLGSISHNLQEHEFKQLGEESAGYSGAEIGIVVRDALMQPVRTIQTATHFRRVSGPSKSDPDVTITDLLTPCSPDTPGAIKMSWKDVPEEKLMEPLVTSNDIRCSMETTKPSVREGDLIQMNTFIEDFVG